MPDRGTIDMRRALGSKLRQAFVPVTGATPIDAEIAALCRRIDRIGGDRPARPFRHDQEQHR